MSDLDTAFFEILFCCFLFSEDKPHNNIPTVTGVPIEQEPLIQSSGHERQCRNRRRENSIEPVCPIQPVRPMNTKYS